MQNFIREQKKMDIFEKANFYLCSTEDIERGYQLEILPQKHYLKSIGNYHFIITDDEGWEIGDLEKCTTSEILISKLKDFYKDEKVEQINLI